MSTLETPITPPDPEGSAVPMPAHPRDWTGHVIVCGLHEISLRTVELLKTAGIQSVVLDDDPDPRLVNIVEGWRVPLMPRGGHTGEPLLDAGLMNARAVICAESSDLLTLETSLLVRDLRDDVRVVVHLDNPAVGSAIEDVTGVGSVLDVPALFAPSVIVTCMGHHEHDLDIAGEHFVIAEVEVEKTGTLRAQYGDLAPVGVVRGQTDEVLVSPGRDVVVEAGDRASVIGTPAALREANIKIDEDELTEDGSWTNFKRSVRRTRHSITDHTDTALKLTLWVGLAMLVVAAIVLAIFYRKEDGSHMSILESIYFAFETGATVGFGDFSFANQSDGMQIFA